MKKTILERIVDGNKKRKKEEELIKKKLKVLDLVERNAYEEIMEREHGSSLGLFSLMIIPKMIFILFLVGIFSYFLLDINLFNALKLVSSNLLKMWTTILFIGLIYDLFFKPIAILKSQKKLLKIE